MDRARLRSALVDHSSRVGTITGQLSFPSQHIPPLTIFAIRVDNGLSTYYSIETTANQAAYSIEVDPGTYNVYAFRDDYTSGYTSPHIYVIDGITHEIEYTLGEKDYVQFTLQIILLITIIIFLLEVSVLTKIIATSVLRMKKKEGS